MALCCAAIRRDSVSLLKSPLLSHVKVLSCGMFIIIIIIIIIIFFFFSFLLESFSRQFLLMVFHWSLSDSNSPQVSGTFLSILAVLDIVAIWMVSTLPPTSKFSSPFNNPLVTVPKVPITIGRIFSFIIIIIIIIICSLLRVFHCSIS